MVQPFTRTVLKYLINLNIYPSYSLEMPLLSRYLPKKPSKDKATKVYVYENTLVIIAKKNINNPNVHQ